MSLAGALFALAVQAPATTPAQDVADVSTRVCYGLASGTLNLPPVRVDTLAARATALQALEMQPGTPKDTFEALGSGGLEMIYGGDLASRDNGGARTVAVMQGGACRALLLADEDAEWADRVREALVAAGWRAGPSATRGSAVAERRMFLRRDARGLPYLLNLQTLKIASGRLQLFTSVVAIPPNVQLPEGF